MKKPLFMNRKLNFLGLLIACLLMTTIEVSAQEKLILHGKVENQHIRLPESDIRVIRDNELIYEGKATSDGSYKLDLTLDAVYNVSFTKEGYIEKSVVVNTHLPEDISGYYFFQLDIDLFPLELQSEEDKLIPHVATLYYNKGKKGFSYDRDYVKRVSEEFQNSKASK